MKKLGFRRAGTQDGPSSRSPSAPSTARPCANGLASPSVVPAIFSTHMCLSDSCVATSRPKRAGVDEPWSR